MFRWLMFGWIFGLFLCCATGFTGSLTGQSTVDPISVETIGVDPISVETTSAEPATTEQNRAYIPLLTINGAIGPAVRDYLVKELQRANANPKIPLVVLILDTPGGLSSSLRDINQAILDSAIPVACLVYPSGARAASAGTYILYACHIAAMAPATTLGAATPVRITTPMSAGDEEESAAKTPSAMEKKVLNDAIAYIRSLAQLRGRNESWAELAVSEAATLTADEALAENVINTIAESPQVLITQLHRQPITVKQQVLRPELTGLPVIKQAPDWRNKFISTITDPNIAYILMLMGVYGLLLEFYSPGIGIAGIVGGISLLIAMYAFQLLPVNFVGAGLLILGICLLIVESVMPSFGVLGIGGLVAFVVGSIFLIDTEQSYYQISIPLIATFAIISALFVILVLGYLWRSRKSPVVSGEEQMLGANVIVVDGFNGQPVVLFNGEHWAAKCDEALTQGQVVEVCGIKGLTLTVKSKI